MKLCFSRSSREMQSMSDREPAMRRSTKRCVARVTSHANCEAPQGQPKHSGGQGCTSTRPRLLASEERNSWSFGYLRPTPSKVRPPSRALSRAAKTTKCTAPKGQVSPKFSSHSTSHRSEAGERKGQNGSSRRRRQPVLNLRHQIAERAHLDGLRVTSYHRLRTRIGRQGSDPGRGGGPSRAAWPPHPRPAGRRRSP